MKQENNGKGTWGKLLGHWLISAGAGILVILSSARLAAGVLAKGESYEGALGVLALLLVFLGGLAVGTVGALLGKGGWADALGGMGLLVLLAVGLGVLLGGESCGAVQGSLRGALMLLGGALPLVTGSLWKNKRKSSSRKAARKRKKN